MVDSISTLASGTLLPLLLDPGTIGAILAAFVVVIVFIILMAMIFSRYRKVGPNEVLVVSGMGKGQQGFRIVKGGGAFIWPVVEKAESLSLELMTLDVKTPEVYTVAGVPVLVDGVAQIKVKGDEESISTASEQFLSKTQEEIEKIALQTIEGHLRAILGTMTVEEIYQNRDAFSQRVQEVAATDLANMGLQVISFTLRDIRDSQGYLDALGRPRIAQVKRDAVIGEAEAERDATKRSADANQQGEEAKYAAQTRIAEAKCDFEMKQAEYSAATNLKKAEADLAYELQKQKTSQAIKAEQMQVLIVEKERSIELEKKEVERRQRELEATVNRPADAEKYRIEQIAEAERVRIAKEAAGHAEAEKARGIAQAEVTRAKGLAEAEVIQATGSAEALAMNQKAEAWRNYNEAALLQLFIEKLPDLARAIAEPLTRIEKIVVVNSDTNSTGASRVTQDITNVLAQLPDTLKAVSGIDLRAMAEKLQKIQGDGGSGGRGSGSGIAEVDRPEDGRQAVPPAFPAKGKRT